jgi:hypothetical protein
VGLEYDREFVIREDNEDMGVIDSEVKFSECAYDHFFKEEQKKPWWLRSSSCMLVCHCKKCSRRIVC